MIILLKLFKEFASDHNSLYYNIMFYYNLPIVVIVSATRGKGSTIVIL